MTQKNRQLINVAIIIFTACIAIVVAEIFTYNPRLFNLIPFFGQSKLTPHKLFFYRT